MLENEENDLRNLMGSMKPKDKEPRTVGVLDSWIDHAEADFGVASRSLGRLF